MAAHPSLLEDSLAQIAADIDQEFDALLMLPGDARDRLYAAMRHAAIGGGKRLRPLLVTATAALFHVDRAVALQQIREIGEFNSALEYSRKELQVLFSLT